MKKLSLIKLSILTVLITVGISSCNKEDASIVKQDDVYIAGAVNTDNHWIATYWKNGVANSITDGYSTCIAVSGNDICLAGYHDGKAVYWKNGIEKTLDGEYPNVNIKAIAVSKGDVYVTGWYQNQPGENPSLIRALYWKNGTPAMLSTINSQAFDITISNDDVYVAGGETDINSGHFVAKYWKNKEPISLTDANSDAIANSIKVFNDNVYVAGAENSHLNPGDKFVAKYWKNKEETSLTDGARNAYAFSLSVLNNEVYVGGFETNSSGKLVATYWKGSTAYPVSDGSYNASIADMAISSNGDVYTTLESYDSNVVSILKNWNVLSPFDGTDPKIITFHVTVVSN